MGTACRVEHQIQCPWHGAQVCFSQQAVKGGRQGARQGAPLLVQVTRKQKRVCFLSTHWPRKLNVPDYLNAGKTVDEQEEMCIGFFSFPAVCDVGAFLVSGTKGRAGGWRILVSPQHTGH